MLYCAIFLKANGTYEDLKKCSQESEVQIHKYKYTNTASVKVAERPLNMSYIFEKVIVWGPHKSGKKREIYGQGKFLILREKKYWTSV